MLGSSLSRPRDVVAHDRRVGRPPAGRPGEDFTPADDPSVRRRDDPTDPRRRLDEDTPAESTEPGYQDVDDRDGV